MSSSGNLPLAPVLETSRLRLRRHSASDFQDLYSLWSDPVVVRHTTGRPQTSEEVWWRLLRYIGHWTIVGYGFWVIEDKSTGKFLGEIGFADNRRNIDPPLTSPEAGWALTTRSHGRGYATEALRAITAWGDRNLRFDKTVCIISPGNDASVRVADKCGYHSAGEAIYHKSTVLVFERPRP